MDLRLRLRDLISLGFQITLINQPRNTSPRHQPKERCLSHVLAYLVQLWSCWNNKTQLLSDPTDHFKPHTHTQCVIQIRDTMDLWLYSHWQKNSEKNKGLGAWVEFFWGLRWWIILVKCSSIFLSFFLLNVWVILSEKLISILSLLFSVLYIFFFNHLQYK